MTISNNDLAAMGVGFSAGAGSGIVDPAAGLGIGAFGIGMILIAIKRQRDERHAENDDEVATDGGTVSKETPKEAAPEQPAVLDQLPMTFDRFLRQLRTVGARDVDSVRPEQ